MKEPDKLNTESFEEAQRRITGQPPTLSDRIRAQIRERGLLNLIVPSAIIALFPTIVLHDILRSEGVPLWVFIVMGIVLFCGAFLVQLFRKPGKARRRRRRRGSPP